MIRLQSITVGPLSVNCYVLTEDDSKECFVVDPGGHFDKIRTMIESEEATVKAIVLTHAHGDHIGAVEEIRDAFGAPLWMHEGDQSMLSDVELNLSRYIGQDITIRDPERLLQDGEEIVLGSTSFQILHTPGHSPGGICMYGEGILLSGDTLFEGSVGRTDFPGASMRELLHSIRTKLLPLPETTRVFPGHGPCTSLREEKRYNPYLSTEGFSQL